MVRHFNAHLHPFQATIGSMPGRLRGTGAPGLQVDRSIHLPSQAGMFPIDNAMRQGAIDYARRVVVGVNESVGDPSLSLEQAMRRLRYVMERFGVTRAGLGVVPHGLRHQGAADDYRAMTGELPPVAGGGVVERELDAQARQCIAERLGHGRRQIVSAYLGSKYVAGANPVATLGAQQVEGQGDAA